MKDTTVDFLFCMAITVIGLVAIAIVLSATGEVK